MKKRYRHFVPKRIPQTYEKTGNVSTTSLRDLHQAGVFPLLADERQNPAWGYEAEDSPVTVEKPFLSPASVEPASPSGAAALGHSERVGQREEKKLYVRENNLTLLTLTYRIHLLCLVITSAFLSHASSRQLSLDITQCPQLPLTSSTSTAWLFADDLS